MAPRLDALDDGTDLVTMTIGGNDNSTYPALSAALAAVKAKAPNARVAIVGYPWIVPAQAVPGCYAKMPIASGDIPYLRDIETYLAANTGLMAFVRLLYARGNTTERPNEVEYSLMNGKSQFRSVIFPN